MHTLIIKSNSSYGRSEYIAIILSLKWHYFSPCFIHEIYKGLCKLMGLIWFNRGERDFYSIWTFSMNTLHLKQSLSGVDTASSDTAILQSKTQSISSDYLLSFLESRDLSQNKMFLLMSFTGDPSGPVWKNSEVFWSKCEDIQISIFIQISTIFPSKGLPAHVCLESCSLLPSAHVLFGTLFWVWKAWA